MAKKGFTFNSRRAIFIVTGASDIGNMPLRSGVADQIIVIRHASDRPTDHVRKLTSSASQHIDFSHELNGQ